MAIRLFREYKIKFYLNARHYVIFNGVKGEVHPHTWEIAVNFRIGRDSFVQFNAFEKDITAYLAPYQNTILNEHPPFDVLLPTLEDMVDYFAEAFYDIIHRNGGVLRCIEASETPTRSYILNVEEHEVQSDTQEKILSDVADAVLEEILK